MNDVIIQIYGIRTVEDARMVIAEGCHHIGVSYGQIKRTPGQLTCEQAKEIFAGVQPEAVKVGLTVSEDVEEITSDLKIVTPEVLHLSGDIEGLSPEEVQEIKNRFPGLKIMQALPVYQNLPQTEQPAFALLKTYEATTDFFLIDTKGENTTDIGATGLVHDWNIDRALVESTTVPCIIAGGLDDKNVTEAVEVAKPYGADSFSWTNYDEDKKPLNTLGIKDSEKIRSFVQAVKNAKI